MSPPPHALRHVEIESSTIVDLWCGWGRLYRTSGLPRSLPSTPLAVRWYPSKRAGHFEYGSFGPEGLPGVTTDGLVSDVNHLVRPPASALFPEGLMRFDIDVLTGDVVVTVLDFRPVFGLPGAYPSQFT